jgi:hypothetical protein
MREKPRTSVVVLFVIRVCLWIVAFVSTVYWMYYSYMLHSQGIYDPAEYATYMRPVLYTCLMIAVLAVCASFILHAVTKRLKNS